MATTIRTTSAPDRRPEHMEENLLAALTGGGTGAFEQRNLATPDPISIDFEPGGDPNTINCENADFVRMVGGEGETRSGVVDQYS